MSNARTLVTLERGFGVPDGMAADTEGCLWVAIPWAGDTRRYSPEDGLVDVVDTRTRLPTSCAFGGVAGQQLFITSSSMEVDAAFPRRPGITRDRVAMAESDEVGGALLVCHPGVSGPAATSFAG